MRSIRSKIALAIGVIVLVVCVALGVFAYSIGTSAVLEEVEEALVLQAQEVSLHLDTSLEVQLVSLETLAARPELKSMNWPEQQMALSAEIERLTQFLAFGVVDRNGIARYNDGSTAELGDREYVKRAFAGQTAISDLIISRVNNTLVLMFAVPIEKNGEVVGVLIGRQDGTALCELTDRLGYGDQGFSYIFGGDGTIYGYSNREFVLESRNIFSDRGDLAHLGAAVQVLGLGKNGTIRYPMGGEPVISGLATVASTGWTIGLGSAERHILHNESINRFKSYLIWIGIVLLISGVVAGLLVARQLANPLLQIQRVIEGVATGDLTTFTQVKKRDETGRVAQALNVTIESIHEAITAVTGAVNELATTGSEMAAATQQVSASIEEVASTTNHFSIALETMSRNAQTMSSNVQNIAEKSSLGATAVDDIIKEVDLLQNNSSKLSFEISNLRDFSSRIGQIVNIIDEIAEQTDLLALNAAIEAARAGEHGRGFAVVADEVRNLAEQSSQATTEITTLVHQIQSGIGTVVSGMDEGSAQTAKVFSRVDDSGQVLRGILSDLEGVVASVQSISETIDEVNSGGHEIASATEEQAASIQEIANSAQGLSLLGTRLQELAQHFKLT